MTPQLFKELNQITKSEIRRLGVNWLELRHKEPESRRVWVVPPLVCSGELYGLNLRHLTKVSISLSFDDFLIGYDLYTRERELSNQETFNSVIRMFKISTIKARGHMPVGDRFENYELTAYLASLAYYNYEGEIEDLGFDTLVVRVGCYRFGIERGDVLKLNSTDKIPARGCYRKPHVVFGRRKRVDDTPLSNLFSAILEAVKEKNDFTEDDKDLSRLILSMTILLQNSDSDIRDSWLLGVRAKFSYPEAVDACIRDASAFMDYQNPNEFLKDQLSPMVLTKTEFTKLFGNSKGPVDEEATREKLANLQQTIIKERESLCY